ncbi:MAG: COQ9 family protein [Bdellovibrionales bacterium]
MAKHSARRPSLGSGKADKTESIRRKIMQSVVAQVPFDGWTAEAFARGVEQAGIDRGVADLHFPGGIRDVIDLFNAMIDAAMQEKISAEPGFARLKVREKVAFGVRARLEALAPYREAMRRLVYWYAMPLHVPLGVRRLYRTVDLIWRAAGDASTDFNFYTKRGLLAGVLKTTMLFWFDDVSPGNRETWAFLDRRIAEVLKAGKTISLMKEWKPAEIFEMIRKRKFGV